MRFKRRKRIEIEDVKRLRLEPGDLLVLTVAHRVDQEQIDYIRSEMHGVFPENKTLVIEEGGDLSKVSQVAA